MTSQGRPDTVIREREADREGSEDDTDGTLAQVKERAAGAGVWWRQQRIARALGRYSVGNGAQLSGGIALSGLLSIAGALTLALTALVGVFQEHPDFADLVFEQINDLLPGVIATADASDGLLDPDQLVLSAGWGVAGIIAVLVLLNSATVVMAALRTALRAMFGLRKKGENFVLGKLRDLLAFIGLALSVLLTSLLAVGTRVAFDWLHEQFGEAVSILDSRFTLEAASIGISFLVDAGIFTLLFRGLAGARVPAAQLWRGAMVGAVGTGALRFLGASVVANVSDKPLLGAVAAVATLLIWLNFAARITLIVAAFTANPPARPKLDRKALVNADHTPNYVSVSAPETLEWKFDSYSGIIHMDQDKPENEDEDEQEADEAAQAEGSGGLLGRLKRRRGRRRQRRQASRAQREHRARSRS